MKKLLPIIGLALFSSACNSSKDGTDTPINFNTTGTVTFDGYQRVDQTVTATVEINDDNGMDNSDLSYQWFANNAAITGANSTSLELDESLLDLPVYLQVSFTDDDGYNEKISSDSFDVVDYRLTLLTDDVGTWQVGQSLDYGSTWSSFSDIAVTGYEYHYDIDVASDGKGNLVAVAMSEYNLDYGDGSETDVVFSYSNDNGETWSETALIVPTDTADSGAGDYDIQIETSGDGTWAVVWSSGEDHDGSGSDYDIVFATSKDNGVTWSSPELVNSYGSSDSSSDSDSMPAFDISGDQWFVAWYSSYDIDGEIGTDKDILYSTSTDEGQTWTIALVLNTDADTDNDLTRNTDYWPKVDISDSGFGIIAWGSNNPTDLDVFSATTTDFGVTWANETVVNSYADVDSTSDADYPHTVIAEKGGSSVLTWEGEFTTDFDGDSEPFYAVSTDDGVTWSTARSLKTGIDTDSDSDRSPMIIKSPSGGWVANWSWTSGESWVATSDDLVTWSTPLQLGTTADYFSGWIFH